MYYDEDLILDIRLNTLNDYIDKFVIVEAKRDHQGNEKKLNFQVDNFKKFEKKIIYKVIETFPEKQTDWERENFQRNFIATGLNSAEEDDYIIISDGVVSFCILLSHLLPFIPDPKLADLLV